MKELKEGMVDKNNPCDIYDGLINLYQSKRLKIKEEVETGGIKKEQIEHGDYGYFPHNGNKIIRFFARTNVNRIEAFCTTHFGKCGMGANVNKNPEEYFICGNLFN